MPATLPSHVHKYAETPIFTKETVPQKLINLHDTKAGVWGRLVVLEGSLDYIIEGPPQITQHIDTHSIGIIEPTVLHRVEIVKPVKFKVEFLK